MRVEFAIASTLFLAMGAFAQDNQRLFEPGIQHTCVPSLDRSSWDCAESNTPNPHHEMPQMPAAAHQDVPSSMASVSVPTENESSAIAPPVKIKSSSVPYYLLAPDHRESPVPTQTQAKREPEQRPAPNEPTAEAPMRPSVETASAPSPDTPGSMLDNDAFRVVAPNAFVLELAHGPSRKIVETAGTGLRLPHGRTYLLRFLHNGADWFVAAWGEFDSLESARAARNEATAAGAASVGFPRRAGPLQEEIRRTGD